MFRLWEGIQVFECNLCFKLVGPGEECECVYEDWYPKDGVSEDEE